MDPSAAAAPEIAALESRKTELEAKLARIAAAPPVAVGSGHDYAEAKQRAQNHLAEVTARLKQLRPAAPAAKV